MMREFIKSLHQFWRVGERIALRSVELSVSHQPSMDTLSMFSTLLLSCLFSSLPPSFMDFAVKICSLISPSPLLPALWWQKNKILSHKKWSRQLKSMLQQLFALNQFSWLLILWKSNLILNRWCGSKRSHQSFILFLYLKKKSVFFLGASDKEKLGVMCSNGTLGFVVANWGCGPRWGLLFLNPAGFKESTCPLIGDPAEK